MTRSAHNAGIANKNQDEPIAAVSTEEFELVMVTNALGPKVVNVLLAQRDKPGLQFLDREGRTVLW
jgi:NAD(P)-dependent dehydrogenase (short-subunit alcohol dehydrogenase family)